MGRPKGSKNKTKTKKTAVKKKVGRPKGSTKKSKKSGKSEKAIKELTKKNTKIVLKPKPKYKTPSQYTNLPDDYVEPKSQKFAGYCPKCDMCLTTKDVSKGIYECVGCGSKRNKKFLLKESKAQSEKEMLTKKQYLRETAALTRQKKTGSDHHISDLPDVSIMNKVKD